MPKLTKPHALIMALTLLLAIPATAADDADNKKAPASAQTSSLAKARSLIADADWQGAIQELKRVNNPRSADWNNLMGYSLRKSRNPDLVAAQSYYDEALRIEPMHRGALEYSGELYLMKGDLKKAEQRLSALGLACAVPCQEQTDLQKAIEAYKANGNRYVPPASSW